MKRFTFFYQIVLLISIAFIANCSGGSDKTSITEENIQKSDSTEELELHQKRIVYQIPEMKDVICHKETVYHTVNGMELNADIYVPPVSESEASYPLVIIVNDYPDSLVNKGFGIDQKDLELYVSWAELIAASGMVAVTYESQFSHSETDSLIKFLTDNKEKYSIDMSKIGLFGASANTLAAQSLMQNDEYNIKCAVFNYGILLTPDNKYYADIDSVAKMYGFYLSDLREITKISEDIPLFVTRAGKDMQIVNETTDHFVAEAMRTNVQLTYINYSEGQHNFDILDDTKISRSIIRQTVDFLTTHLKDE